MLKSLDEDGPDPEVLKELRRATDLALRATARAIGRNMGNLLVQDCHLWPKRHQGPKGQRPRPDRNGRPSAPESKPRS